MIEPDELAQHPEIHAEAVDAVVERHEDRVDREREVEKKRRAEEDGQGAPRAARPRASGRRARDGAHDRLGAARGVGAHERRARPGRALPGRAGAFLTSP